MSEHNDNFTIASFLRAICKGPDECPEWWRVKFADGQVLMSSLDKSMHCKAWQRYLDTAVPHVDFADILTNWTRDKDALLLGVGLEWVTSSDFQRMYDVGNIALSPRLQSPYQQSTTATLGIGIAVLSPKPGETLARTIFAAVGEKK